MYALLPMTVLLPLIAAIVCFLLSSRWARVAGIIFALLTSLAVAGLCIQVAKTGVQIQVVGDWLPPLGIVLRCDGLAAFMIMLTALVAFPISLYASSYYYMHHQMAKLHAANMFWPLWFFLWGGLNALYLSGDVFNVFVLLEVTGLAAVGLLVLKGGAGVLQAGLRYLLAAMAASFAYLLGVVFLYGLHGTLDMEQLGDLLQDSPVSRVGFALMAVGLLLKSAVFPLHFWLPAAHAGASAPVSAALSALVVKAGFYLLVRLQNQVFPQVNIPHLDLVFGLLASGAVLWGSVQALRQQRLKMLIAYSTVAQIGYLFFLLPVLIKHAGGGVHDSWAIVAMQGSMILALAHALAKASLFLAAGVLMHNFGNDSLNNLRGLANQKPLLAFAMALAGVSLMGLPPSGGFIGKWFSMQALVGGGLWVCIIPIVLGSLLAVGYVFRILRPCFLHSENIPAIVSKAPKSMEIVVFMLALGAIALGFMAEPILHLLQVGSIFGTAGAP